MNDTIGPIQEFVAYARTLKGDEKGEAQVFDHGGSKEADGGGFYDFHDCSGQAGRRAIRWLRVLAVRPPVG